MAGDAGRLQVGGALNTMHEVNPGGNVNTKLMLMQAGADIGMGFRAYIRIEAQPYPGPDAHLRRNFLDKQHLRRRFRVKGVDIGRQRHLDFGRSFAHPGKNNLPGRARRRW